MSENIKYGKATHSIMSEADDAGTHVRNVVHRLIGRDEVELERYFDWCEANGFEIIVKLYYDN